jgi:hypothetical protein
VLEENRQTGSKQRDSSNAVQGKNRGLFAASNLNVCAQQEVLIFGSPDHNDGLPVGVHAFEARFALPDDAPSSFSLDEQNPHTGVFYVVEAEFRTITKLRSAPEHIEVEGILNTRPLDMDCRVQRHTRRSIIGSGQINLNVVLHRSILMAGDLLRFDVDVGNGTQKKLSYLQLTLKQQLTILTKGNKRMDVSERVFFQRDDKIAAAPPGSNYRTSLEFTIPPSLPQTQTTSGGSITIEYHLNVALSIPWAHNLRVRLPLAILKKTRFPDLLPQVDAERIRRASFVGSPTGAAAAAAAASAQDAQYALPNAQGAPGGPGAAVYTPAPLHTDVYTPAPAKSRAQSGATSPRITRTPAAAAAAAAAPVAAPPGYGSMPGAVANVAGYGSTPAATNTSGYGAAPPSHRLAVPAGAASPTVSARSESASSRDSSYGFGNLYESMNGSDELAPGVDVVSSPNLAARRVSHGYVSDEDIAAYDRATTYFKHFDRDHNGVLDRQEFKSLHADLVKNAITTLSYDDAWNDIDADGNGLITFNEYVDFLISVGSLRPPPSPPLSRRNSFSFHPEPYPFMMTKEETMYGANAISARRSSTTQK